MRSCHFCGSIEGKPRNVGRFIVELKPVEDEGSEKLACQTCYRFEQRNFNIETTNGNKMKASFFKRIQQIAMKVFGALMFMAIMTSALYAQGLPAFPSNPEAAPIDGGLGLLAAAGGVYAWKKLRNKSEA